MDKDKLFFQSLKENGIVGIYGLNGVEILRKAVHKTGNFFYIGNELRCEKIHTSLNFNRKLQNFLFIQRKRLSLQRVMTSEC